MDFAFLYVGHDINLTSLQDYICVDMMKAN